MQTHSSGMGIGAAGKRGERSVREEVSRKDCLCSYLQLSFSLPQPNEPEPEVFLCTVYSGKPTSALYMQYTNEQKLVQNKSVSQCVHIQLSSSETQ